MKWRTNSIFFTLFDTFLSLYYWFCGLSPIKIVLDHETTIHFWTTKKKNPNKPNLLMIHGYGGDARPQFIYQIGGLSSKFNLYIPDLVFFGKSYSNRPDRSDVFQARCMIEGLNRLGVDRFSVYSISYGGFVAYRMAEMCPDDQVEKVVIVSSGLGCTEEQKREQLRKIGKDPKELLLPRNPSDLRLLMSLSMCKSDPLKWVPDFFLQQLINGMGTNNSRQKLELVDELLAKKSDTELPILSQETLLIWGDHDNVFPVEFAQQLQRHLGSKSKLEIIKNTGHAANIESPHAVNSLIISFILGHS